MNDDVFNLISKEQQRQEETLGLIPSENYASKAVMQAVGSVMMNKYSEGQVGKRYYQGNEYVDAVEALCKQRALQAFGLDEKDWGVNVQALSGSPANLAIYNALLEPGDRVMGMYLPDGGHLSHGWQLPGKKVTFVSKVWDFEFYKVEQKTRLFDYDLIQSQAEQFRPKMIVSGGTAYPREIDHKRMAEIAHSVGAYYLADVAHEAGLIAGGANTSPFPHADVVMMTTHKTLRGPRGAMIFSRRQETNNKQQGTQTLPELIDFSVFPGLQGGPHNEVIAGLAVALGEVLSDDFKQYAKQTVINAQALAQILMDGGLDVLTGGTDKHLIVVDMRSKGISGWTVAWALDAAGIVLNRNTVPNETASPFYPSGIRLGTPGVTTRGMRESEMEQIGAWILEVVEHVKDTHIPEDKQEREKFVKTFTKEIFEDKKLLQIKNEVTKLCRKYPIYS